LGAPFRLLAPDAMLMIEPRCGQHGGQEGLDRAVHRAHVEVEGEAPLLLGAVEHGAVVHEAGGIEEHVHARVPGGRGPDRLGLQHVEHLRVERQAGGVGGQ
jgi:hypothetical protein